MSVCAYVCYFCCFVDAKLQFSLVHSVRFWCLILSVRIAHSSNQCVPYVTSSGNLISILVCLTLIITELPGWFCCYSLICLPNLHKNGVRTRSRRSHTDRNLFIHYSQFHLIETTERVWAKQQQQQHKMRNLEDETERRKDETIGLFGDLFWHIISSIGLEIDLFACYWPSSFTSTATDRLAD